MRPIAILRFSPTEGPGHFADWLDARGLAWQLVPLDDGAAVPTDPRTFAGIAMMGGPMSAYDPLPWIAPLSSLLRTAVDAGIPVIGHCLGGQLLAQALGAKVARAPSAEVGWVDVRVCDARAARDWFGGRAEFGVFQWHYDAFALPAGATRVLTNAHNVNQGFVVGDRHIGLECHVEMTRAMTESWLATGAEELPASSSASVQSATEIRRDLDRRLAALHAVADDIYARWATQILP